MTLLLIAMTAGVYGFLMKLVLKNVYVSGSKKTVSAPHAEEKKSRELVPAYDR